MFCILAWALACKFSQLNDQLNDLKDLKDIDLRIFGIRHSLVCQAVWQLEEYFQNIMLLCVSYIFVGAIDFSACAFSAFNGSEYNEGIFETAQLAVAFVLLDAICNVAERLKDKVLFYFYLLCQYFTKLIWRARTKNNITAHYSRICTI